MLNTVCIQGRLVKDCEVKQSGKGTLIVNFTLACQRNFKGSDGKYPSDFIDCVAFEKTEFIPKYFHKGDMMLLQGEIQTNMYKGQDGKNHKSVVIVTSKANFCGDKGVSKPQATQTTPTEPPQTEENFTEVLPFE